MEKTEKISVSDLSVGDWVGVQFPDGDEWIGIVASLSHTGGMEIRCSNKILRCTANFLKPIPITAEVLKKNGLEDAEFGFVVKRRSNKVVAGMCVSDINYVHELQHALRLAKVDKDIEL